MSPEDRRKAFERMVARWEARGFQIESDPSFLESIEDWIEGRIEIPELRVIYKNLVRSRNSSFNQ